VRLRKQLVALAFAAGMTTGVPSRANADIIYSTTYSTTGRLTCENRFTFAPLKNGSCTLNGNSVVITSDAGQTLTVSFIGVSNVPIVATVGSQIVDIGTIQTTLSGPGTFFFPERAIPVWYPFQFGIDFFIQTSVPVSGAGFWFHSVSPTAVAWNYAFNCCPLFFDNNAAAPYDLVFGNFRATPGTITAGESTKVTAVMGLFAAPEPSTIVLTAAGLLLVAGVTISRRRAASRVALS